MADKLINQYPVTSSIGAADLVLIGNINTGTLYTVEGSVLNLGLSQSLNTFEAGYNQDSGSFNNRILSVSGSLAAFNTGSLALTASVNSVSSSLGAFEITVNAEIVSLAQSQSNQQTEFNIFTGSYQADSGSYLKQIANVYASESNYTPTSSFNALSSSLVSVSSSLLALSSSVGSLTGSYVTVGSFDTYTSSIAGQILNVYASQSNYLPTSSFTTFSASVSSQLTGSVNTGSLLTTASFVAYTSSTAIQILNVYASESNYQLTSSFNTFSQSLATQVSNIYASESNYLPTSSFNTFSSSYVHDSASFLVLISSISGSGGGVSIINFNSYTASTNTQIANVYASESNYLPTSSFTTFSASVNSKLTGSGGGSLTSSVLNFLVGDGQSFTPMSGSTVFSSSLIVNRTILQVQQEGFTLAPISRSVSWYSFTSSIGQINLNNTTFITGSYFQIIYT
jgi:hypothetical protein